MDIEKVCINNLGKEIDYGEFKVIIVGYNLVLNYLIASATNDCGWQLLEHTDIILLHSPLNISYFLVNPVYYRKELIL